MSRVSQFWKSPYATRDTTSQTISRRALLGGIGAAGIALALSGCVPAGSKTTTIRFLQSKPEVVGYFDALIKKYNASQSKVFVVHDSTSLLAPQFVRGNVPDLALYNYNLETARYIKAGVLSDLSDLPEAKTIQPNVQSLVSQFARYPGRTSVLPYSVTGAAVIYNKKIFREHGVRIPTTWDEMLAVCKTLKSAGVMPIYGTYKDVWTLAQGAFDYATGGYLPNVADFYKQLNKEGAKVGPSSNVSFIKNFHTPVTRMLSLNEYTNPDAGSRAYPDGNLAFAKGKSAMYFQGPWAFTDIALTSPHLDLGCFPLPMTDNASDTKIRVNLDLALWIPTGSQHPEASRDFLQYLMTPAIHNAYCADNLSYGVTKGAPAATDPRISQLQPFVDRGAFYQGPQTYLAQSIPIGNYIQGAFQSGNGEGMLSTLDADWNRIALRSA